jgi:dsDNA-specific endonuclease/ATPase MutS2
LELHVREAGRLFIKEGSNQVISSDEKIANTIKAEMEQHKTEVLSALSTKLDGFMTQVKQEVQKLSDSAQIEQNKRFAELLSEIRKEFPSKQPMTPPARVSKRKRQDTDAQVATRNAPGRAMKEEPL